MSRRLSLALDEARKAQFAAGPPYATTRQLVACHRQLVEKPREIEDLRGLRFAASAGSPGAALLAEAGLDTGYLSENVEALLARVAAGRLDCALTDGRTFGVVNPYYPELMQAFELTGDFPVVWLTAPGSEDLAEPMRRWFAGIRKTGQLSALERRFFGFLPRFDYVDLRAFQRAVDDRLPLYEKAFRRAARENNLSWQLLAAIAYQESHWDPEAVSPTGVRGLMMLTRQTARQLGVEDRLDPSESIAAAARYLVELEENPGSRGRARPHIHGARRLEYRPRPSLRRSGAGRASRPRQKQLGRPAPHPAAAGRSGSQSAPRNGARRPGGAFRPAGPHLSSYFARRYRYLEVRHRAPPLRQK